MVIDISKGYENKCKKFKYTNELQNVYTRYIVHIHIYVCVCVHVFSCLFYAAVLSLLHSLLSAAPKRILNIHLYLYIDIDIRLSKDE